MNKRKSSAKSINTKNKKYIAKKYSIKTHKENNSITSYSNKDRDIIIGYKDSM